MTPPGVRSIVRKADVEAAQAVIDAWADHHEEGQDWAQEFPYLRGLITQALADAHAHGHDHGVVRGRRLIAQAVRNSLADEGL